MNDNESPRPLVLARFDSAERRAAAAKVLALLKPVTQKEMERLVDVDDDYSDKSSDIPDPFSDDESDQQQQQKQGASPKRKRMSNNEIDTDLMDGFSEEHKRVERLVREKTGILASDDPCRENLLETEPHDRILPLPPQFLADIRETIAKSGLEVYLKQKELAELERLAKNKSKNQPMRSPVPTKKHQIIDEMMDTNSMSGVWRMLDAPGEPEKDGFVITQPGYNALDDDRLEWLRCEDISWQQRDEVKHKCEQWMKKCNI